MVALARRMATAGSYWPLRWFWRHYQRIGSIFRHRVRLPDTMFHLAVINSSMIFQWDEILQPAIETLPSLHQEIVIYVMEQPGKRKPTYKHARATWNLDRDQFDRERAYAFGALRRYLNRFGLTKTGDLKME